MARQENEQYVKSAFFEKAKPRFTRLIGQFVRDVQPVLEETATIFESMLADMAYIDKMDHPMASSVFSSCATLAVYLALKKHGIVVHDLGCAILTSLAQSSLIPVDTGSDQKLLAEFIASGEASQKEAMPGEYVFEAFAGDHKDCDWGVNIKSCALCHAFSKYDAMDLVPYMCAMNDVLSDKINQGLRRTGTIALGAKQCVYRYKIGGEPKRLVEQYPDQIRYSKTKF
jgi:L-2-amino-thiazoline-4-carboxylic acid hydrolase